MEKNPEWFFYDTIIILDNVLTDDTQNPIFSANTGYYRLENIINFHTLYFGEDIKDVNDFLLKNGYTDEDIKLLKQKRIEENKRYKE